MPPCPWLPSHRNEDPQTSLISLSASSLPVWLPAFSAFTEMLGANWAPSLHLPLPTWSPGCRAAGLSSSFPFLLLLRAWSFSASSYILGSAKNQHFLKSYSLQEDTAKAKKMPLNWARGFVDNPHMETWDSAHLPCCFPWGNNPNLLKDTVITVKKEFCARVWKIWVMHKSRWISK